MANVIFDFDGTLADTFPLIVDVSYRLSPGAKRLPEKEIARLRRLPLLTAMRSLGIPILYTPLQLLLIRRRLTARISEVPPYEGVPQMLSQLHKDGHRLFVLTSNYKENAQIFLGNNNLQGLFVEVASVWYASRRLKARALRSMMKRHDMKPEETYYIGNEELDIEGAESAGIQSVAAAWGGFNKNELKKARPDAIIDKPQQLVDLLK